MRSYYDWVYCPMKNDRLCSLGLVHIHRDFEMDLYKAMGVFVSAKTQLGQIVDNFKKFLSIKVIKIVLDSMALTSFRIPM